MTETLPRWSRRTRQVHHSDHPRPSNFQCRLRFRRCHHHPAHCCSGGCSGGRSTETTGCRNWVHGVGHHFHYLRFKRRFHVLWCLLLVHCPYWLHLLSLSPEVILQQIDLHRQPLYRWHYSAIPCRKNHVRHLQVHQQLHSCDPQEAHRVPAGWRRVFRAAEGCHL